MHNPIVGGPIVSLKEIHGVPINRIMHFYDSPKTFQNLQFSLIWGPLGMEKRSGIW